MFDNLKKAFSNVSTGFSEKDLNEKDIEDVLFELEINLLESDVATEVIDSIKDSLKEKIIGSRVEKKNIQSFVKQSLSSLLVKLLIMRVTLIWWLGLMKKNHQMNHS